MSVTFRVTKHGTSQLGMNFRSVRFLYNMLTLFRTYQSWQIVEHRRIQKKRANLRVGSLLNIITMEVTYFKIVTLTCLRPTRIASARVLKQRSIRRPLIAPPVSAAIAIP